MSEYNIDIADMQCWVFRMAQSNWYSSKRFQPGRRTDICLQIPLRSQHISLLFPRSFC